MKEMAPEMPEHIKTFFEIDRSTLSYKDQERYDIVAKSYNAYMANMAKGFKQGIEQGREEAREEQLRVAREMKATGMDVALISRISKLSLDVINNL